MSPVTDFPTTDLSPLRHQQVRAALVREARTTTGGRVPRRAVPLLAGLSVLGVGAAVALPTTGLGSGLRTAVGALVGSNPCPPAAGVGYRPEYRRPTASDDTAGVRFLPSGTPGAVTFRLESACPLPERPDRPIMRPDALWTLARVGPETRVDAVVTLYRGLPAGISEQVADRTSQRLPTDGNDPGTVLDPPFREFDVRSVVGILAERPGGSRPDTVSVIWVEPGGRLWSLQATGLTADEVAAFAGRLRVDGDDVEPGEKRVFRPSEVSGADLAPPFWYRLDVPDRPAVNVGEVSWSAYLFAKVPGRAAGTSLFTEIHTPAQGWDDWRLQVQPGDSIIEVDGREALLGRTGLTTLQLDLPSGGQVRMSVRDATGESVGTDAAVTELTTSAASLTAVPADDPRLVDASVGD